MIPFLLFVYFGWLFAGVLAVAVVGAWLLLFSIFGEELK